MISNVVNVVTLKRSFYTPLVTLIVGKAYALNVTVYLIDN